MLQYILHYLELQLAPVKMVEMLDDEVKQMYESDDLLIFVDWRAHHPISEFSKLQQNVEINVVVRIGDCSYEPHLSYTVFDKNNETAVFKPLYPEGFTLLNGMVLLARAVILAKYDSGYELIPTKHASYSLLPLSHNTMLTGSRGAPSQSSLTSSPNKAVVRQMCQLSLENEHMKNDDVTQSAVISSPIIVPAYIDIRSDLAVCHFRDLSSAFHCDSSERLFAVSSSYRHHAKNRTIYVLSDASHQFILMIIKGNYNLNLKRGMVISFDFHSFSTRPMNNVILETISGFKWFPHVNAPFYDSLTSDEKSLITYYE